MPKGVYVRPTLTERLNNFQVVGKCWNWSGVQFEKGYGQITFNKKATRAHRLIACIYFGIELDDKRLVLHKCDNPQCINPAHLYLGTNSDNQQDRRMKGH